MNKPPEERCSRFIIWKDAAIQACEPESRQWLEELLRSLEIGSLQHLNGLTSTGIGADGSRLREILEKSNLGRLVNSYWPRVRPSLPLRFISQDISILELSVRSMNCLNAAEVKTIGQLMGWSQDQLLALKNMGKKSATEIRDKLDELLRHPNKPWAPPSQTPDLLCLAALLSFEQFGLADNMSQQLRNAGIFRMDDLVTRSVESLRYWAGLTDLDISQLGPRLDVVDLPLESRLPSWVRTHYLELQEGFENELEQISSHGAISASPGPAPVSTPTSLEDECEALFFARSDDRERKIVRSLMGWDAGLARTLEAVGQDFGLTKERIRQIREKALRPRKDAHFVFLQKAIDCIGRCAPAPAENAEAQLAKEGIIRTAIRVESIQKTAALFELAVPWVSKTWNDQRYVLDATLRDGLDAFLSEVDKRVSHYGLTRKAYISAGLSQKVHPWVLDLYFTLVKGLIWLDSAQEWFWLPTARNVVLNRLAKILRVVPRLTIADARDGILRDRRMRDVVLPLDVFRNLCGSCPWCKVEGNDLVAAPGLPQEFEESHEMLLVEVLRRDGPVMRRRDLRVAAAACGIQKVHYHRLVADSNLLVSTSEFCGLIGSDLSNVTDTALNLSENVRRRPLKIRTKLAGAARGKAMPARVRKIPSPRESSPRYPLPNALPK